MSAQSNRVPRRTKRQTPPATDYTLTLVALDAGQIVYRCKTISEGLAFIAGRRTAVLCQVLCYGRQADAETSIDRVAE